MQRMTFSATHLWQKQTWILLAWLLFTLTRPQDQKQALKGQLHKSNQQDITGGPWLAQSVKCLTLAFSSGPHSSWVQAPCADSSEQDALSPSFSAPPLKNK